MAPLHPRFCYLLFYYAGPSSRADDSSPLPAIYDLFTALASLINARGDARHIMAITTCQLEGLVDGGLSIVCADDYVVSLATLKIDFGVHAALPMGGNELRFFPAGDDLHDAPALAHYLGILNANPLQEKGRKPSAPPFFCVLDHAGSDTSIVFVKGGNLALPSTTAVEWGIANANPVVDRSKHGLFFTGIPVVYPPATIVQLLGPVGVTEEMVAAGAWWAQQPNVAGAPRVLQIPTAQLAELEGLVSQLGQPLTPFVCMVST